MYYERFTHKARRIVILAKRESKQTSRSLVGPEHILIGVILEETGIGAKALKKTKIHLPTIRSFCQSLPALTEDPSTAESNWMSKEIKYLFEQSWGEAQRLGHSYVSTEHLLLAILNQPRVGQILRHQAISGPAIRKQLLRLLVPIVATKVPKSQ